MHFGDWLQHRRRLLHLSQEQLASGLGVSATTIRNWERADTLPRTSLGNKTALARELRLSLGDLQAIGKGEKEDAPIEVAPSAREPRDLVKIINYTKAKHLLNGLGTSLVLEGGYLAHRISRDPNEFAWIMEDDCMAALDGYLPGDLLVLVSANLGRPLVNGDDVFVQFRDTEPGMVRRVAFGDDLGIPEGQAVLSPLNLFGGKYKSLLVSRSEAMRMPKVACLVMRTPNSLSGIVMRSPNAVPIP